MAAAALTVISLWLLTGWYLDRERQQTLEFATESSRIQVQLLTEHTAALFRQVELGLRSFDAAAGSDEGAADDFAALRRAVFDLPGVDNAAVVASDGSLRCALRPLPGESFPTDEIMVRHRDELVGFSIVPAAAGRSYLTLSVRFDRPDGDLAAVVAATVPRDYFTSRFRVYGTINADVIALYQADCTVLARWPSTDTLTARICDEPLLAGVPESELSTGGLRAFRTAHAVIAVDQLPGFPYRVVIATSDATVLGGWRSSAAIIAAGALAVGIAVVAAVALIRWLSARNRASDRALEQSRERERAAKISRLEGLRALAGGLAHDINNRMMVVLGNSRLLDLDPAIDSIVVGRIKEAARQTSALADRMLSAAGTATLVSSRFDVAAAVRSMEADLRNAVRDGDDLVIDGGTNPCLVNGDSMLVATAVRSLVENASGAATARASTIHVEVRLTRLDDAMPGHWSDEPHAGDYVAIAVTDHGEGIDFARRERVFDPFYSARFLGRGLGLSAVAGVARQHGGTVAIESELGRGTTVTIYLPLLTENQDAHTQTDSGRS